MSLEESARKHALKNALDHGKAEAKAVVGRVIAEVPEAKKDMKGTMGLIAKIVAEVNGLSKEQLEAEISKYTFIEKKKEEKGIELPEAEEGKVVTRFPPEPNGYPHIGHAKAAFIGWSAARKYKGKFLLRFDDTNPDAESAEFVGVIKEAFEWLGIDWDSETYTSDYMPKLYGYCEQLISSAHAYVCTCKPDEIKDSRAKGKVCDCRSKDQGNLPLWKGMLEGSIAKGQAIVRFVGDMKSENTVMRDPALFRIIETPHYRQGTKYRVWPTYDFEAPILDSLEGVTHAMRSKEYELRDELYFAILGALALRKPKLVEFSRLSIKGMPVSKRLLKPLIQKKEVTGWDDPRLPTIAALRRRGITKEAIRNFVLSFGLGKTESNPTIEALLAENKKILDPVSERYFFVGSPVKLDVKSAPGTMAKLKKHPDKDLGVREIETEGKFFISGNDAANLEVGSQFRLKDLYNVKVVEKGKIIWGEFAGTELKPGPKIQWVVPGGIEASVLVPGELVDSEGNLLENSMKVDAGYCEKECANLSEGQVVQFERYGFCRLDDKKGMKFIYTN
ncbi:MAG: glutamate--tRNA ligase, partial [Candidatus Micrarchaeota archaeon]